MTISYDPASGRWKSRYSYDTSCFDLLDNVMLSFDTETTDTEICYSHSPSAPKNNFYGGGAVDSELSLSFNKNPSTNKVYKALSLEGANLDQVTSDFVANLSPQASQRDDARVNEGFVERGGIFYGGITKIRSTENENGLKLVGEITLAQWMNSSGTAPFSINNGNFPFQGIDSTDPFYDYIFFSLIPYPHYRALDSASSEDVISKYYVGWQNNNNQIVVTPFFVGAVEIQDPITDTFQFTSDGSAQALNGRIDLAHFDTFESLSGGVYNTNTNPKIGNNILVARVTEDVVEFNIGEANTFPATILAIGINNYIAQGNRLFLYKITDDRIDGSDPMGQYADVTLNLGTRDFELFAVNAEYSATPLDHSN